MKLSDILGWVGVTLLLVPLLLVIGAIAVEIARETHPLIGGGLISFGLGGLIYSLALALE